MTMRKYLVLYRAPISSQEQMAKASPDQKKAAMDAWMAWSARCGSAIIDMGAPLGETAYLRGSPGTGHIGGYSFLQAESLDAARKLMEGHPHLEMPGASIEILETIPMRGR
jgi:hypothetical protein